MHQIRFRLGELTAFPRTLAGFGGRLAAGGGLSWGKGREGRREKWRGRKGRAPKLLLNQGPSEPCYATVCRRFRCSTRRRRCVVEVRLCHRVSHCDTTHELLLLLLLYCHRHHHHYHHHFWKSMGESCRENQSCGIVVHKAYTVQQHRVKR